ncbi:hypothetical protein [Laceyella putida]|uniref:Uncharacterized protein n=1 Tax=Laceyella putida TaxID=110101 RepID=A0ABW2RF13_9BACL
MLNWIQKIAIRFGWKCPANCGFTMEDGKGRRCPYCHWDLVETK